ncbi:hypothetical protein ABZ671_13880 [Micromonospora sp. NPDC006766]|uniref:hypothetical protein n=1 Tax=Micromonospora sp. NPDC006766 TaxID=3154778 RepID=UPI0033F08859
MAVDSEWVAGCWAALPITADYIRIADEIVADIRAKKLKPGDKLPSIAQLAAMRRRPRRLATWYVDDIDQIVDELVSSGVEFIRYDQFEHDAKRITARAGGGRIAWFQDPDGNTFAREADD